MSPLPLVRPHGGAAAVAAAAALAVAALLAGCANGAPPEQFHTLLAAPAAAPLPAQPPYAFRIGAVHVPPQVDRPQWVLRTADGSVQVLEQQRWAAPLADEWRAALSQRLQRRLGALDVSALPPEGQVPPAWRIAAEVQRFDATPGGEAVQQVLWSLRAPGSDATALACRSTASGPAGTSYGEIAAAQRQLVERVGDAVADALQALQAGQAARCP
jgi:uncharacterized lipoprotein YmbA